MHRRTYIAGGALAALGALSGCLSTTRFDEHASETVERSFAATAVGELRVKNAIGNVRVAGGDVDEIELTAVKRSGDGQRGLDAITLDARVVDGLLTVETRLDDDARWHQPRNLSVDLTLTVPRGDAGPLVTAVGSDIGDVTLSEVRGDTVVRTDLGDVHAADVDGFVSLESDLGDVTAARVAGVDLARTDLGDVKVDLLSLRGDVEVGSDLGNVVVGVASDLDLDVFAEGTGHVDSDLTLSDLRSERGRLTGRLNGGGRRLHAFSSAGAVSLRELAR